MVRVGRHHDSGENSWMKEVTRLGLRCSRENERLPIFLVPHSARCLHMLCNTLFPLRFPFRQVPHTAGKIDHHRVFALLNLLRKCLQRRVYYLAHAQERLLLQCRLDNLHADWRALVYLRIVCRTSFTELFERNGDRRYSHIL